MTRPLIGVTTSRYGGWRSYLIHHLALKRAGARAVRLIAGYPLPKEPLQGLIIGGGDDISAKIYGGQVLPNVRIDPERDSLELGLLDLALPMKLPILGICRGSQMINVALGGTLHTDIHEVYIQAPRMRTVLPKKRVLIAPGSKLDRILGCNPCCVNALHHQSVNRIGEDLAISAQDDVGIVQAIEGKGSPFLIGVQWHPELLIWKKHQQSLFRALSRASQESGIVLETAA
ncbi:gamma-glutamyl-gamma-aminobutyrate hydrolase family protein [Microvirga puerhi]|uniref:Gamma-glutamyl-gamma-aminobutyrate hydrolase family protein n=1 Tax=Microvirga puerhi TaxID=2876078 RepID=A0ABS7VRF5_9HYPH|nr:gamma-glutamyl-gamma-aminobutyrate hydrolase family protein [Microvirga puerhi]MBZ6077731.1 gamma-glutamyl-gamma-aminobutyrate hydrolase family protein [Microvirga puerhi]